MENQYYSKDFFKGLYGSLHEFADRISSLINYPITIEDANHRLLAYSAHTNVTDQARILTIMGRRVPEKVINALWKKGIIPFLLQNDQPIIVDPLDDVGLGKRIAVSIRKNDEILGFIWALESDTAITDEKLSILAFAAKEAKNQLLLLQSRLKSQEDNYQEFFWKLLTGHYPTEKEILADLVKFPFTLSKHYTILVFEFTSSIDIDLDKQIVYLISTTQKVSIIFHTIDQNKLILLLNTSKNQSKDLISFFIRSFKADMKERFNVTICSEGCGNVYSDYIDTSKSYLEALEVISLKKRYTAELTNVQWYDELGLYQYLHIISEKRSSQPKQLPTGLNILKKYDEQHQTQLYETLEIYLTNNSNPAFTANTLHIHPNTLSYRLKRITEISQYDLKDHKITSHLLIEMKLSKY